MENRREYEATVENARVWVLLDGRDTAEPEKQIDTNHIHQYVEVFVCCKGEICIELSKNEAEGREAFIPENACMLIPIEYSHHLVSAHEGAEWYSFGFHVQRLKRRGTSGLYEQLSRFKQMELPCLLERQERFCAEICRMFLTEYAKNSFLPALQITTLLSELIQKNGMELFPAASHALWIKDGDAQFTVLEHILAARYMEPLHYRSLCADLHISERQLSRIIKKRYGTSWHKLLTEKRLEAAKRRMKKGERNLGQIAEDVGFSGKAAFCQAFVKAYGMTPRQYCERAAGQPPTFDKGEEV